MQFLKYSHLFINKKRSRTRKKNGRVFFAATKIAQASKKVNLVSQKFVPNKYSFRFISHQKEDELLGNLPKNSLKSNKKFVPNKYSFRFISHQKEDELLSTVTKQDVVITEKEKINDEKRRLFLKTASIVGAGVVGATLLPKKADALVMGGTPGSSVVGVKNISDTRINPATEGTVDSIKTATEATKIATDSIKTNTDTLVTNSNKFTFSGGSLVITGANGADVVGLKDATGTRINPVSEDAVVLLRRMVKLMESQATVDVANRQRMTVDAWGAGVNVGTGTSANCPRVALGTDSTVGTVTAVTNVVTVGSYAAQQMYGDVSHDVYANSLRRNLTFTSSV